MWGYNIQTEVTMEKALKPWRIYYRFGGERYPSFCLPLVTESSNNACHSPNLLKSQGKGYNICMGQSKKKAGD